MDKSQLIFAICFASSILIILISFLLFVLLWQRRKSNAFLKEKEHMQRMFTEQLLTSQLEMQEQTFTTISEEIHDNIGQLLSLVKVQLNIIDEIKSFDQTLFQNVKENVSNAMTDLRDIAKSLNTERIQSQTLYEIIKEELERINRCRLLVTTIQATGTEKAVQDQKKLILFRMVQESLQNVFKHAEANHVDINLSYEPECICIVIADDGKGFNTNTVTHNDGLGIINLVNRASLIGGSAEIESTVNKGTVVKITCPYV